MSTDCNSCSYDCSKEPSDICLNTDITGIGVVVGYVVTALVAVFVVVIYYVAVFSPNAHPFQKHHGPDENQVCVKWRPNPIDKYVLSWVERKFPRKYGEGNKVASRLEKMLIKCTLNMSDLQIVTGISILVSGYVQLTCGLSAYHWQVVVYLAWFSSLTHLSCLSVLRSHLCNRTGQRLWRLIAMAVIIIMIVTAIVPTGNFDWSGDPFETNRQPRPSSHAICLYRHPVSQTSEGYPSMVISTLLVVLGFTSRIVKLHKTLSIDIALRLRTGLSRFARQCLRGIYDWSGDQNTSPTLSRLLIYRPLLVIFLVCRVSLDLWSSMFLEVWWLIIAFCWGAIRLFYTLQLYGIDTGRDAWTFGQVIPLVLLAAPLISILEISFERDDQASPHRAILGISEPIQASGLAESQTTRLTTGSTPELAAEPRSHRLQTREITDQPASAPIDIFRDGPDFDFYQKSWFKQLVLYFIWMAFSLGTVALLCSGSRLDLFWYFLYLPSTAFLWEYTPLVVCWVLVCFTLFRITIEDMDLQFQHIKAWPLLSYALESSICSFLSSIYLLFIGIPTASGFFPITTLTQSAFLIPPFLIVAGNKMVQAKLALRRRSVWRVVGPLLYVIWLASLLSSAYVFANHVPFEVCPYLYLIPTVLYIVVCLIYCGLAKSGAFGRSLPSLQSRSQRTEDGESVLSVGGGGSMNV